MNELQKCDICENYTTDGEIIGRKVHCEHCIEYCPNCNQIVPKQNLLSNGKCTGCDEDY